MAVSYLNILAQLAYFFTLLSYGARNIFWLRLSAILASACALVFSFNASSEPLWIPIFWNLNFLAVNGIHLALSRWRGRDVKLNALEDFLAKTALANFPPAEVRSFAQIAREGELAAGSLMIKEGSKIEQLYCLLKGKVDVFVGGEKVAELGPGRFVGEMSLLTRSLTRADVRVNEEIKALVWLHKDIENWVDSDASRLALLQTALGSQVVETLLRQSNASAGEIPEAEAA
jgi:Cyclic nucleotide-binding domain